MNRKKPFKCPWCGSPHNYNEKKFPAHNAAACELGKADIDDGCPTTY